MSDCADLEAESTEKPKDICKKETILKFFLKASRRKHIQLLRMMSKMKWAFILELKGLFEKWLTHFYLN